MNGKIIGIISIKGGVGKTTTVVNLAAALANEFSKKVLIVDANFSAPNLGLHLGLVKFDKTLHDVLADKAEITKATYSVPLGFDIIPSSLVRSRIDPFKLKRKLRWLKSKYDVILIDSSPTLNEEILAAMMASDELLVVTSPDYPTLSCTMNAVKVAKEKETPIVGLIVNKIRNKNFELTPDDIEEATGAPVLAVIPDDDKVLEALAETKPAVVHAPNIDAVVEYKKLAAALVGEKYDDTRIKSVLKKFFLVDDYKKQEINRELVRTKTSDGLQ